MVSIIKYLCVAFDVNVFYLLDGLINRKSWISVPCNVIDDDEYGANIFVASYRLNSSNNSS